MSATSTPAVFMKDCPTKGCTSRIAVELQACSECLRSIPQPVREGLIRDQRRRESDLRAAA